jgi:hypothetical protein
MSYLFSFTKSENRGAEWVLSEGSLPAVGVEDMGKGCGRVNMVQILCTHVCKWKNETCLNCCRNGGEGIKENNGGMNSNNIFDIL